MAGSSSSSLNNNQLSGYNRMQRTVHVSRARRSGVIVGTRPLVPASVVPEDLIQQVSEVCVCVGGGGGKKKETYLWGNCVSKYLLVIFYLV